ATLAPLLCEIETSPWGDLWGKPLDARGLARRLRPFGVIPKSVRLDDGKTPKGYTLDQFKDAFARYLGELNATTPQPASAQRSQPKSSATNDDLVADKRQRDPASANGCGVVADKSPGTTRRPVIGDEMYLVMLLNAARDGHITNAEAEDQYAL